MPLTDKEAAAGRLPGVDTLFPGDGEMALLMRARDWSLTPLGPAGEWPQALRAMVRIMLTSRFAIWLGWGPELTFLYNDAYRTMTLGSKHPAVLGRPTREVWAEIWPQIGPRIERVLSTGEATWDEALQLFLERSGYAEETYHTFSYSPVADDLGVIRGNLCIVTEETERVIGERRLALLAILATRLAPVNTTGEVLAATEAALATGTHDLPFFLLYHLDADGRHARLVSSSPMPEGHPGLEPVLDAAALSPWPLARLLALGEPVVVDPLPAGAWPAGAWDRPPERAVMTLVTQPGQARPAGIFIAGLNPFRLLDEQYQSFLGLLVGQISAALSGASAYEAERRRAESLAELDRAKTVFFSNVSHEFRTPLTLMLGPIDDLRNRGDLPDSARYPLAVVQRNGLRLLRLVNTLLDFSRIEAGRAEASYEPVDLAEITADLVSAFRSATERAGLALVVDCPPLGEPVYVDRGMWEKVVLNLVANAFKYTLEGEIEVQLRRRLPADGTVQLVVRDTGIGIPESEMPYLFERFRRVEGARGRTHEGSGIGLALVHELVKLHGGEVAAASDLGRGSTFTVTLRLGTEHLPAARLVRRGGAAAGPSGAATAVVEEALRWLPGEAEAVPLLALDDVTEAGASGGPRGDELILLADDNADMRDYIRRLLAPRWRVEAVANGRQALAAIQLRRPDLVISDVMMPELDGFGLLQALRADPRTHDLPVLLLSAHAGEEARFEGLAAGADDYIVKPFSAHELEARVEARLLRARLRAVEMTELVRARHEAEVANRTKDEFLAMLGHELRNPLAPILTALQLLRLRGVAAAENECRVIERQVKHLVTLVDDLLDVSRLTRGKLHLERRRVELSAVVAQAIETASPLLERNRHQLTVEVPRDGLAVDGDQHRLVQVVANLLANAAKYTDPGGRIFVTGTRQRNEAVLTVRDTGIGISAEMLPKVFDLFVQTPQALDRSHGGLGLGLALARGLIDMHQGTVEARSDGPGTGAELIIRLPLAGEEEAGAALGGGDEPAAAVIPAPHRRRILVVDDNRDAALMLAEALAMQGHQVQCAYDGPQALEMAQELAPEVAVLDLGLPLMDGFDLARRFAAHPVLRRTRLVAVTGYGQEQDRQRTAEAAFAAHFVKPVDLAQLCTAISELAAARDDAVRAP